MRNMQMNLEKRLDEIIVLQYKQIQSRVLPMGILTVWKETDHIDCCLPVIYRY